jgi:hypothetical protein
MAALEKIKAGADLIDVWAEFTDIQMEVDKAVEFADKVTPIQIEDIKTEALKTLREGLGALEESDRISAAKALLQHYRDEKRRLAAKERPTGIDPNQGELFGSWDVKKPGSDL